MASSSSSTIQPGASHIPVVADVSSIFNDPPDPSTEPAPAPSTTTLTESEPATEPHGQTFLCTSTAHSAPTPFSTHPGNQPVTVSYQQQQQQQPQTATPSPPPPTGPLREENAPLNQPALDVGDVEPVAEAPPPRAQMPTPSACLEAPTCPDTHPYKDPTCVEAASGAATCKMLVFSVNGKRVPLGRPGAYDSPSDAIHQQRAEVAHTVPVGASSSSSSMVVSMLPRGSELVGVAIIKTVEASIIAYVLSRFSVPMPLKVLVAVYFFLMLDYHMRAALNAGTGASPSDVAFEHLGMRHIEAIDADTHGNLIVFHDGGRTQTFEAQLVASKCNADSSRSCAIYKCCAEPPSA